MTVQAGVVGKPNVGKSTFFAAATLVDVKIAPYPFTTIEANKGVGYVKIKCVCRELGVEDNPVNSVCIDGWRFVPVELIDVAGLVPDAWQGRGLGNRFLDELRRANVLIHVIDAAGATDIEGRPVKPGTHDPVEDVQFLEREITMWMYQIISKDWSRTAKALDLKSNVAKELSKKLSGLGITIADIEGALSETNLLRKKPSRWTEDELKNFIRVLREKSKPIIIAANKSDLPAAEDNIKRLRKELSSKYLVIPTSAESELALRKAASKNLIKYLPGDSDFEIIGEVTPKQRKVLEYIREKVLKKWGSTGVQQVINAAFLDVLEMLAVFPVENENKYTDHHGRVLPDVYIVPKGTTAREFAYMIHTDLGEKFISAVDVKTKKRLSADFKLEHRMVIKIIAGR
ncbi:MAG: redox-regulated ATPase YchF [Thermoprotei archaeon]|nr:MAG: redox-regulated ATPase YchF [Thermoprotei archaeon]